MKTWHWSEGDAVAVGRTTFHLVIHVMSVGIVTTRETKTSMTGVSPPSSDERNNMNADKIRLVQSLTERLDDIMNSINTILDTCDTLAKAERSAITCLPDSQDHAPLVGKMTTSARSLEDVVKQCQDMNASIGVCHDAIDDAVAPWKDE